MIRTPYSPFVDTCNHTVNSFSSESAASNLYYFDAEPNEADLFTRIYFSTSYSRRQSFEPVETGQSHLIFYNRLYKLCQNKPTFKALLYKPSTRCLTM